VIDTPAGRGRRARVRRIAAKKKFCTTQPFIVSTFADAIRKLSIMAPATMAPATLAPATLASTREKEKFLAVQSVFLNL